VVWGVEAVEKVRCILSIQYLVGLRDGLDSGGSSVQEMGGGMARYKPDDLPQGKFSPLSCAERLWWAKSCFVRRAVTATWRQPACGSQCMNRWRVLVRFYS
jgi:hypothetical protein